MPSLCKGPAMATSLAVCCFFRTVTIASVTNLMCLSRTWYCWHCCAVHPRCPEWQLISPYRIGYTRYIRKELESFSRLFDHSQGWHGNNTIWRAIWTKQSGRPILQKLAPLVTDLNDPSYLATSSLLIIRYATTRYRNCGVTQW